VSDQPSKQPSGLAWAPYVPAHWTVKKLAFLASLKSGDSITADDIKDDGPYPVYGGNGLRGYTDRFTHDGEYALIGRQGALCGNINYAKGEFWASEHAVVVAPREEIAARWLGELLRAMGLNQYSVSAAQPGLSVETIAALRVPIPPLKEQRAIADYIDRETSRLDALVEAKELVLGLLAEKRRALITRAVTRGLDPRGPLRDSGIPWLGEIPAHWRVMRAGLAGRILMGRQRAPQYEKGTHMTPYLRVANVFDGFIDYSDVLEMNFEPEEQALFGVLAGDILLNEGQSRELVGRSAIYRGGPDKYCFQNTLIRFRCGKHLDPEFVQTQFASWLHAGVFQLFCRQSTNIAHLGADRLAQIHMVVPPKNEQQAIIEHIEREIVKLDNVRAATERTISLLKERRSGLIAAAVTGQISVMVSV
jgi:type I restriction enzyme S subunit